jgi:thiamine-monophosphate kinase
MRRWLDDTCPRAPFGIGDDCAVLPATRRPRLVTTDPVIFGRHFDRTVPARAAGAKLLKRNLSDIAAMGGIPESAVLALALAPDTSVSWLREFYLGLAGCARKHRVKIVGGDITEAPRGFLGAFLTLEGEASGPRIITRRGARAGDYILVTGHLGGSRAGRHFRFEPRLKEGVWLARQRAVVAMMDISDGLAKDLGALTPAGLVASVRSDAIPASAAAKRAAERSGRPAWEHAVTDGEDYELLVVLRSPKGAGEFIRRWRRSFKLPLAVVGRISRRREPGDVKWENFRGFEHLR